MIDVVGVTHHYGVRPVLRDVNLRVESGQLVALMGPNGMGKSTLLAVIAGALAPYQGYVEIGGLRRRSSEADELAIRRQVFYLPDQPWLPSQRTGREYVLAVGRLYDVEALALMDHAQQLFDVFDLADQADSPLGSYSAGQRKKAALCAALASEAPVLVLDEPLGGGLDPAGLLAAKRLLQQRTARRSVTAIVSSPVPELVEDFAARVAVLRDGQVLACDTIEALKRQAGAAGTLQEALQTMLYPDTVARVDRYLAERP